MTPPSEVATHMYDVTVGVTAEVDGFALASREGFALVIGGGGGGGR